MRKDLRTLQSWYTTPTLQYVWHQLQPTDDRPDLDVLGRVLAQMHSEHDVTRTAAARQLADSLLLNRRGFAIAHCPALVRASLIATRFLLHDRTTRRTPDAGIFWSPLTFPATDCTAREFN
jgi:hypothetical protein